jgi:hypothetical protein
MIGRCPVATCGPRPAGLRREFPRKEKMELTATQSILDLDQ